MPRHEDYAGEIPFVLLDRERVSVQPGVMKELGLTQGQTINQQIFIAILEQSVAYCISRLALLKAGAPKSS